MVLLGAISIIQIFLPGYIFTRLFTRTTPLTTLILSFGTGLLFNYQFVFLLTAAHAYNHYTTGALFFIECIFLMLLRERDYSEIFKDDHLSQTIPVSPELPTSELQIRWINIFFIGVAAIVSYEILLKILSVNPGIFDSWDDVVSWNRWAVDWYNGHFPVQTWHYPQLMPANWSMMYQLTGTSEIQFFVKFSMSFYAIGILLIFFDLYNRSRSLFFLIAFGATGYLIVKINGAYIGKGYADIPIAFFSLTIFYIFYLARNGHLGVKISCIFLALILSAAVLTKQAGFVMVIPFLVMLFLLVKRNAFSQGYGRTGMFAIVLLLLMVAPWYSYKELQIGSGVESSEIGWVTNDIYAGKSISNRISDGAYHFYDKITSVDLLQSFSTKPALIVKSFLIIGVILLSALSITSFYGRIALLVVVPYFFIWAAFFSYDVRNVAPLLPFLGICIGIGFEYFVVALSRLHLRSKQGSNRSAFLAITFATLLVLILLSIKYTKESLLLKEKEMARTLMGDAELNAKLYELYESGDKKGKTLSANLFLKFLPGLGTYYQSFDFSIQNLEKLEDVIAGNRTSHEYTYLVLLSSSPPEVLDLLQKKQESGAIRLILRTSGGWTIMEIVD